jgi:hypothetical protein
MQAQFEGLELACSPIYLSSILKVGIIACDTLLRIQPNTKFYLDSVIK